MHSHWLVIIIKCKQIKVMKFLTQQYANIPYVFMHIRFLKTQVGNFCLQYMTTKENSILSITW